MGYGGALQPWFQQLIANSNLKLPRYDLHIVKIDCYNVSVFVTPCALWQPHS